VAIPQRLPWRGARSARAPMRVVMRTHHHQLAFFQPEPSRYVEEPLAVDLELLDFRPCANRREESRMYRPALSRLAEPKLRGWSATDKCSTAARNRAGSAGGTRELTGWTKGCATKASNPSRVASKAATLADKARRWRFTMSALQSVFRRASDHRGIHLE
jgi:hypothetical protein